jgi:hypothetical protein
VNISSQNNTYTSDDEANNTSWTYLSPATAYTNGQEIILGDGAGTWSEEQYRDIQNELEYSNIGGESGYTYTAFAEANNITSPTTTEGTVATSDTDFFSFFGDTNELKDFQTEITAEDVQSALNEQDTVDMYIASNLSDTTPFTINDNDDSNIFDLASTQNVLDGKMMSTEDIKALPNQMKALLIASSTDPLRVVSNPFNVVDSDGAVAQYGRNLFNQYSFIFNYVNLTKIEVLISYPFMNSPQWRELTPLVVSANRGKTLLCRMQWYENTIFESSRPPIDRDFPIYNEHFLLEVEPEPATQDTFVPLLVFPNMSTAITNTAVFVPVLADPSTATQGGDPTSPGSASTGIFVGIDTSEPVINTDNDLFVGTDVVVSADVDIQAETQPAIDLFAAQVQDGTITTEESSSETLTFVDIELDTVVVDTDPDPVLFTEVPSDIADEPLSVEEPIVITDTSQLIVEEEPVGAPIVAEEDIYVIDVEQDVTTLDTSNAIIEAYNGTTETQSTIAIIDSSFTASDLIF